MVKQETYSFWQVFEWTWLIKMPFMFSAHAPQTCKNQQSLSFLQHRNLSFRKETWNQQATEEIVTVKKPPHRKPASAYCEFKSLLHIFWSFLYTLLFTLQGYCNPGRVTLNKFVLKVRLYQIIGGKKIVTVVLHYDELYSTENSNLRNKMLFGTFFECFRLNSAVEIC